MKTKTQKLNNIIGQINGVKKMMEEGKDCLSVLTQLKAVRSGINSVMDNVMEDQFNTCFKKATKENRELFLKMRVFSK